MKKQPGQKKFSQTMMHVREKENWDLQKPSPTTSKKYISDTGCANGCVSESMESCGNSKTKYVLMGL